MSSNVASTAPTPVKAVLRKPTPKAAVIDTSSRPVDENAADRLAEELGVSESDTAVATIEPTTAVTVPRSTQSSGDDFDQEDTKLPQLKIVNGSGELSKQYNQGTLLYADEVLFEPPSLKIGAENPVLHFVPMEMIKQFRENLTPEENEDGIMPRVVTSREEAESLGGSTRWIGQEKPRWSPSAKIALLLIEPEGTEHPGFSTPLDGKNCAPAVYYCSGMAYNNFAKVIFNNLQARAGSKWREILTHRVWSMQVVKAGKKFTVFVPSIKVLKEETGPEVRALARNYTANVVSE